MPHILCHHYVPLFCSPVLVSSGNLFSVNLSAVKFSSPVELLFPFFLVFSYFKLSFNFSLFRLLFRLVHIFLFCVKMSTPSMNASPVLEANVIHSLIVVPNEKFHPQDALLANERTGSAAKAQPVRLSH